MENYIKVEVTSYVNEGINSGKLVPRVALKFARKVAQVQVDKETNQPGWIATKVDEDGNIIIDNNNHANEWIIDDTTFKKKYEIDPET